MYLDCTNDAPERDRVSNNLKLLGFVRLTHIVCSMRVGLLGRNAEKAKEHVRPLNDTKAIEAGANFISETFLL